MAFIQRWWPYRSIAFCVISFYLILTSWFSFGGSFWRSSEWNSYAFFCLPSLDKDSSGISDENSNKYTAKHPQLHHIGLWSGFGTVLKIYGPLKTDLLDRMAALISDVHKCKVISCSNMHASSESLFQHKTVNGFLTGSYMSKLYLNWLAQVLW